MALPAAGLLLAGVVAAAAGLVLLVRPRSGAHKTLGALMLLQAGFLGASALVAAAPDARAALVLSRLAVAWLVGTPFITLYLATLLWPDAVPFRRLLLALSGAAVLLLGLAFALDPVLLVEGVARLPWGWVPVSGPLLYAYAALSVAADAAFVVFAARAAADPARSDAERGAAGAFGVAFGIGAVYSAGFFAAFAILSPERLAAPLFALRALPTIAAGALVAALAPRLGRALRALPAVAAGALVVAGQGALDGVVVARPGLLALLPGYQGAGSLLRVLFVAAVVLAVARHGLAEAGDRERRKARVALRVLLALAGGSIAGLAALGALGAAGAGALALVAALALWRPADALARRALLAADDPRAVAQRARRYAAALAATRGHDGRVSPEAEALLADLRRDLGVTQSEHEMLARGLESRETLGRYVLGAELGRGATATVHLATDAETGREVVVKRYHDARDAARVVAEARALRAVDSPRVVRLLDVDRRDGKALLVMERAAGGSAAALLQRGGPLPPERALALAGDLLDGLAALHAAGLVHGDVKCENLLLDAGGRGLLADFGSARAADASATLTGAAVEGTLATLAPEVARGARPTPASDVYSAGATLYRLLTGEHPVDLAGADALAARERILAQAPRLPHPRVPSWVEAPLGSALAKRPEERPPGAAAFRALLTAGAPGAISPRR